MISDLYYSFYLTDEKSKLSKIYKFNPSSFTQEIQKHFYILYQKDISKLINDDISFHFEQADIDNVFNEFALFFYESDNKKYLKSRNIPQDLIDKYKLGSTHIFFNENKWDTFISSIYKKYNKNIIKLVAIYHKNLFLTNLKYYNDANCSTIPCFDKNNICKGIVYRVEGYTDKYKELRNIYKFHVSHAPSYMFNQHIIDEYDTIILVEGVFDALSLVKIGYPNVVSVSHLKLSEYQFNLIKGKNIIMIYDNDLGGLNGLEYFYEKYHHRCKSVKYYQTPEKDIDTMINLNIDSAKNYLNAILS